MLDIHYHLLFDLDDGPRTFEDSVQLAEASIAEGVTHIVSTPHANDRYGFRPEVNQERIAMLQEHFSNRLTLGLGCDLHLSYENIQDALSEPSKYTINGKRYLLVEFSEFSISPFISEWFYQLIERDMVPIITHPERNPTLVAKPERMVEWLRLGCLIQITAASLTGRFGKQAMTTSEYLLERNWVHFIASDAHSLQSRPPAMRKAYELLRARYGQFAADRLCTENPRAAFNGDPLPPQPEMYGLYEKRKDERSFFQRLLGR